MKAAVLAAPRQFEIRDAPAPVPGPAEVRIQLEGCGVCASNLEPWEGRPWFAYPLSPGELGHEGWGRIDALGSGVSDCTLGERVAFISSHAFAEFDTAAADALLRLPPQLDHTPFPGEPLGCAMNILSRSGIHPGDSVAIVGIGFLGALLTRLVAKSGARIMAIGRRPYALEFARAAGAEAWIPMDDQENVLAAAREFTKDTLFDVVIEATGRQRPLDLAAELTRERGKLVIAGYHQDGQRQVNMQMWNWRGMDVINAHERDPAVYMRGMREARDAILAGNLDPTPLYTHSFTLNEIGDAFRTMSTRPDGFMKAVITYGR